MESCKAPRWGLRIMMGRATGINSRPKGGSCGSREVQNYLWGGPSPGWVEKSFIGSSISLKRFEHRLFVHIKCFKLKLSTLRRAIFIINIIRYFKDCAHYQLSLLNYISSGSWSGYALRWWGKYWCLSGNSPNIKIMKNCVTFRAMPEDPYSVEMSSVVLFLGELDVLLR